MSLSVVLVLGVVEVAGHPSASGKFRGGCAQQLADDFPELAVRTFVEVLLRVHENGVEEVDGGQAVAHDAGGHARCADDRQQRSGFSIVGGLYRPGKLFNTVVR